MADATDADWRDREHWVCPKCQTGWCVARAAERPVPVCPTCELPRLVSACDRPDYYDPPCVRLEP